MKTILKVLAVNLSILAGTVPAPAAADLIEGRISDINWRQNTFQISPAAIGEVTEKNIFVVRSDTVLEKTGSFRDLKQGDPVRVEADKVNEVVWKATFVARSY